MKIINKNNKFITFYVGGVLNNAVGYLIFCTMVVFNINYLIASSTCFILCIYVSYFFNRKIVFKLKSSNRMQKIAYFIFYCIQFLLSLAILHILVEVYNFNPLLAQLVVGFFLALLSYMVIQKLFNFIK